MIAEIASSLICGIWVLQAMPAIARFYADGHAQPLAEFKLEQKVIVIFGPPLIEAPSECTFVAKRIERAILEIGLTRSPPSPASGAGPIPGLLYGRPLSEALERGTYRNTVPWYGKP